MKAVYKFKKLIFFMAFFSTIVYLTYRVFFTIPTDNILNIVFGIIILSLELLEGFFYGVYYLNILLPKKPNPRLPKIKDNEYPELDILIATINEDKELVEETIKKCLSMKYPDDKKKHIYLCDDGKRFEMKDLCKRLKINYIDRKNNKNAKAGNYNNALTKTSSPYVVVFDADMQPEPNFLLETVPYLVKDKNIGFVQTPQCFRNADIYQPRFNLENEVHHEQSYFFEEIQSSKNTINSVIYCGTNAVFRREALEEAGGFATESITEDIATGIMIESLGYKAISINKKLAFGLNVNNFDSYTKQKI